MFDRYSDIHEGMDVYDRDGDKVGTIKHVFSSPISGTTSDYTTPSTTGTMGGTMPSRGIFQVDTGFLGLGKDYFVPFSAITGSTGDRVTLDVDKDNLDQTGWDRRPDWLPRS